MNSYFCYHFYHKTCWRQKQLYVEDLKFMNGLNRIFLEESLLEDIIFKRYRTFSLNIDLGRFYNLKRSFLFSLNIRNIFVLQLLQLTKKRKKNTSDVQQVQRISQFIFFQQGNQVLVRWSPVRNTRRPLLWPRPTQALRPTRAATATWAGPTVTPPTAPTLSTSHSTGQIRWDLDLSAALKARTATCCIRSNSSSSTKDNSSNNKCIST